MAGHEVDGLRRHLLRGNDEVAFVLPVLVVDQDDEFPLLYVANGAFDAIEGLRHIRNVRYEGSNALPSRRTNLSRTSMINMSIFERHSRTQRAGRYIHAVARRKAAITVPQAHMTNPAKSHRPK